MGNNASNISPNNRLGISITKQVSSNTRFPSSQRGSILSAFIILPDLSEWSENSRLYHIILVSPRSIDMFCLLTGDARIQKYQPKRGIHIMSACHSKESIRGNIIVVAESDKIFKIIHTYTFAILSEINSHSTSKITCMINPAPDLIYAGFHDGSIKVWHFSQESPQFYFHEDSIVPSVRTIEYSHIQRFIVVGYENSYQKEDGSYVKLDNNPLRIYYAAANEQNKSLLLEGFLGACLSIVLIENKNLVIALSSVQSGVYIWDFITRTKLLCFNVPIMSQAQDIASKLTAIEMPGMSDILLIGKSDGSILVSQLTFNEEDTSLTWSPLQKIQPKMYQVQNEKESNWITYLSYDKSIDAIITGDASCSVRIVSNLFDECLGIKQIAHESQDVEQLDKSLEEEKKYDESLEEPKKNAEDN
ncbi:unnamed protein product [Blepharisma stoltei]|uniref:Uncharacterized protein n=1 Tax=Blepharisma stoltei TaxID=1481888 RepID=A0AAU9KEQ4_9CILI|nr:unnamed protein product [Blepharisma stoltei]